jgi:hypothetical protein
MEVNMETNGPFLMPSKIGRWGRKSGSLDAKGVGYIKAYQKSTGGKKHSGGAGKRANRYRPPGAKVMVKTAARAAKAAKK